MGDAETVRGLRGTPQTGTVKEGIAMCRTLVPRRNRALWEGRNLTYMKIR